MNKVDGQDNLWRYDIPAGNNSIIFNIGSNSDQTGNLIYHEKHVYTESGDTGKTLEEYLESLPDPAPDPDPTENVYVYLDANNANPAWDNVYAYVYNDNASPKIENATWPGTSMIKDESSGYWSYKLPDNLKSSSRVVFSCNGNSPRYPADNIPGLEINGKSMIFHVEGNKWEEYDGNVPEPGELIDYTIYFYNNVGWDNVNVSLIGNTADQSDGGAMYSPLNSKTFQFSFKAPENYTLSCNFYYLENGSAKSRTSDFKVVNGNIYTITGDKGPVNDYVPVDREAEYWLEPAKPSQNDGATLYYNRAFKSDSKLKDTDLIYAWLGALTTTHSGEDWDVKPGCSWGSIEDKYRMTRDEANPDIYYIKLTPSIAQWLDVRDPDTRLSQLAVLFRDKDGNDSHKTEDYFIDLQRLPEPGVGLGAYVSHELTNSEIVVTAENGKLFLTPMSSEVIKVFTLKNGLYETERPSISVIPIDSEDYALVKPESFNAELKDDYLSVTVDGTERLRVDKASMLISFLDNEGNVSLKELNGLLNNPGNIQASFDGMGDDGFYGGGYNGKHVNWEGKGSIVMNNSQTGGWAQDIQGPPHNICIPYFVSTNGYGVYFDDHYRGAELKPSAIGTLYVSKSNKPIAYYYIGGGSMEKAMQNYTRLTGLQELPPFWAMGYITSKFSFKSRNEAEEVIRRTKESNLPLDGIVFDIHWQGGPSCMGKINWDTANYKDPQEMMANFRNQNVHTIAITEPYFTQNSGNYNHLNSNGFFADSDVSNMGWLGSTSGLLDITNANALEWYKNLYKDRTREGIESWWLDLGEPERHDDESHYSDNSSVNEIHNEYGQRWLAAAFEAMKELDSEYSQPVRRITMPRSGTAGMQRYNAFPWTGDIKRSWGGLKAQVPALVSAAMSGVSYLGSDIGGFCQTDWNNYNERVYLRWIQLGVFYPAMRTHADSQNDGGCHPEPYYFPGVLDQVRDAINLRYAYLPYTYSQSYAYTRYGSPIARPANFADADKSRLNNCIDAYYWGPDLFVAPMLSDGTSRSIDFPEGDWLDMNHVGTIYNSSTSYNADLSTLPYFMRRGSFLTRYAQDTFTSTAEIETNRLIVHYFPNYSDKPDGSTFFDDDHQDVNSIKNGKYVATNFSGTGSKDETQPYIGIWLTREGKGWSGMYDNQEMTFQIHDYFGDLNPVVKLFTYGDSESASASAAERAESSNKTDIPQVSSQEALKASAANGYCVDNGSKTIFVKLAALDPLTTYSLGISRNDIFTGMEGINLSCMMLSYGAGTLSYSAPEGTEGLCIDVYSTTGVHAAQYDGLRADGYVSQVSVDLPSGIYIARLTGHAPGGASESKTVKIVVK